LDSSVSKQKLTGPPSEGYQEEINWVKRTIRTIQLKNEKYIKYPDVDGYNENYLVIFDVRPESPFFKDVTQEMLTDFYLIAKTTVFSKVICLDSNFVTIDVEKQKFEFFKIEREQS
jgi:hypothetical protein